MFHHKRQRAFNERSGYGKTLTVLSSRKVGQETYADEGDDEADLVERWTPRFRK